MREYKMILQGETLYISRPHNKGRKIVIFENVTDLIAYEVKIDSTIKDLNSEYKIDDIDIFYRLIIQTVDHFNDIELIYNNIDNIKHDYNFIKQFLDSHKLRFKNINDFYNDMEDSKVWTNEKNELSGYLYIFKVYKLYIYRLNKAYKYLLLYIV